MLSKLRYHESLRPMEQKFSLGGGGGGGDVVI